MWRKSALLGLAGISVALFSLANPNLSSERLSSAGGMALSNVWAGGCYDCAADPAACAGDTCTQGDNGSWWMYVGTHLPAMSIVDAQGVWGVDHCTLSDPESCHIIWRCAANCTCCTPAGRDLGYKICTKDGHACRNGG
jgi:hypothetical protein